MKYLLTPNEEGLFPMSDTLVNLLLLLFEEAKDIWENANQ